MRRLAVLLALMILPAPTLAQPAAEPPRAFLTLSLNGEPRGEAVAALREPDVLVRRADLDRAGLRGLAGRQELIAGEPYVSLASLAPAVRFRLDARALALHLTADPALLPPTVRRLHPGAPAGLEPLERPSAFLNTALSLLDLDRLALSWEGGLRLGPGAVVSTATLDEQGWARGLSLLTVDDRARLWRWQLGDHLAPTDPLGGAPLLGGLSLGRDFSLDPYTPRVPLPALRGLAATRSTVEVAVNGQRVYQERLPPGPFELRGLPVPIGHSTAELVLRDAFGRETRVAAPVYFTPALLRAGEREWRVSLGWVRAPGFEGLGRYGPLRLLAHGRAGVSDGLTLGGRLELGPDLASGGLTATARLPWGEADLALAGSLDETRPGWAAAAGYRLSLAGLRLALETRALSEHYAHTSLRAAEARPRLTLTGAVGLPLTDRATLSLQATAAEARDGARRPQAAALLTVRLGRHLSLVLTARHLAGDRPESQLGASLVAPLGGRATGLLSAQRDRQGWTTALDVQRVRPLGPGAGGRLALAHPPGHAPEGLATLQVQGRHGLAEATWARRAGRQTSTLTAAAGLVALDGRLHLSRPVGESFALVRAPEAPGARVLLNRQEIGRTDARGTLVVPSLTPLVAHRLGLAPEDLPVTVMPLAPPERLLAPPPRGGAVVSFPLRRIQGFTGTLEIDTPEGPRPPAGGQLTVTDDEGRRADSPIGRDGAFYLENLPPGRYPATIDFAPPCRFTLEIPAATAPLVDLGPIRCSP